MAENNCLFCKMVQGEVPYHPINEDAQHLAFLTIFPNTEGVTVVIPKRHFGSSAFEQPDQVLHDLISFTKKTAQLLTHYFPDVGRCGMVFEGFGIDHLHAKVYPLHGTNLDKWSAIESAEKKDFYPVYPGYICSNDSHLADSQALATLAQNIRASAKKTHSQTIQQSSDAHNTGNTRAEHKKSLNEKTQKDSAQLSTKKETNT